MTAHSPLGASGAERWMNCAGSAALLAALDLPESDEPEYRSLGTSAHAAGHACLVRAQDAWEAIGEKFEKHEMDAPMAEAVQVYLDECRSLMVEGSKTYFEFRIDAPDFHKHFFGTLDFGNVIGTKLRIRDYKHGEGIAVDIEGNPQVRYYAYGLLRHHPEIEEVEMGIVQPRAFHPDGPIRIETITADELRAWAENELRPAMYRVELDHDLNAGKWCRFCPAKLVCPLMTSLFGAAMTTDPSMIVKLSDESLGRSYQYTEAVKQYLRAMEEETFRRLNTGKEIAGVKLVNKRANRVWKPEAKEELVTKLGLDAVYTVPEMKSPAEIDKLGSAAKKLTAEWAYTPQAGLTVALAHDKRLGVKVQTTEQAFPNAAEYAT